MYFALYQSLDAEVQGEPLFKRIPHDFFGLIIIDECHRSGFGKWNAILQHFCDAIHLGMTATPKQSESVDTYAYFCSEEPEIPRTVTIETERDATQTVTIELKLQAAPVGKIRVRGLEVTIADEATFLVESTGEQLTLAQYFNYTKTKIMNCAPSKEQLHEIWTDSNLRQAFLSELEAESVYIEVIAEILAQPKADQFDLLAHIAFGKAIHTRDERVDAFLNYEQQFLQSRTLEAQEVIVALLDKYRLAGVQEMVSPEVFRLSPFREMGQLSGVVQRFGSINELRLALNEVQWRLYREEVT